MSSYYTNVAKYGRNILLRGYENGSRFSKKIEFSPSLYVPDVKGDDAMTIDGEPLRRIEFETMNDAKDFISRYRGVSGFEIHGTDDYVAQFIQSEWPSQIDYDPTEINVAFIDIEVYSEEGFPHPEYAAYPITSIAHKSSVEDVYHIWTSRPYDPDATELTELKGRIRWHECDSEVELLSSYLNFWSDNRNTPDIVTGWNIRNFDIIYIVNRIKNILGDDRVKQLSPWGQVYEKSVVVKGADLTRYELVGIAQLDYLDLFAKFGVYKYGPQESFSLDYISHVVLGESKLSYDEYSSLHDLYINNPQKYFDYNLKDVHLVERIDDKVGLLGLAYSMAYRAGVNYTDILGTTRIWDTIIYRELCSRDLQPPPSKENVFRSFPGGYVKAPRPGYYRWVVSFDFASLYPNLIVQYNMSPETISGMVPAKDVDRCLTEKLNGTDQFAVAPNGLQFTRGYQGVISSIVSDFYDERSIIKKKKLETEAIREKHDKNDKVTLYKIDSDIDKFTTGEQAVKILLNSLYGAMANQYFRYFDVRVAEAITLAGQLAVKWAERAANNLMSQLGFKGDFVIAIDTDSIYVDMSEVARVVGENAEAVDKFCQKIFQPALKKAFKDYHKHMGCRINRLEMKREVIANTGFWTGKKHYALNVLDKEGVRYKEPEVKIMGIAAVKSSTPKIHRDDLKECIRLILQEDEKAVQRFIEGCRNNFYSMNAEEIAFPRGVSSVSKYETHDGYIKGTPINSRAAIVYNKAVKATGINNIYELITDDSKIKYLYLKTPNPVKENVIAFPVVLPRELGLESYIDYKTMFDKGFMKVIEPVMKAIHWSPEAVQTLEDFL